MNWWIVFGLFWLALVWDATWVVYTRSITARLPIRAANLSALMYVLSAVSVISYVHRMVYVAPLVVGAWVGSYLTVKYGPK